MQGGTLALFAIVNKKSINSENGFFDVWMVSKSSEEAEGVVYEQSHNMLSLHCVNLFLLLCFLGHARKN